MRARRQALEFLEAVHQLLHLPTSSTRKTTTHSDRRRYPAQRAAGGPHAADARAPTTSTATCRGQPRRDADAAVASRAPRCASSCRADHGSLPGTSGCPGRTMKSLRVAGVSILALPRPGLFGRVAVHPLRSLDGRVDRGRGRNWARIGGPNPGYIHAYRAVTGVDLADRVDTTIAVDPVAQPARRTAAARAVNCMLDSTSALSLGLRAPGPQLRPWTSLTSGVPAALAEAPEAAPIGSALATLMGVERATLARSTLHAFFDLFATLGPEPRRIYMVARRLSDRAGQPEAQ